MTLTCLTPDFLKLLAGRYFPKSFLGMFSLNTSIQPEDKRQELLQCDLCSESFQETYLLEDHMKLKHSNDSQHDKVVHEKMKSFENFPFTRRDLHGYWKMKSLIIDIDLIFD